MTESQQSKQGWFSSWREHRRAKRQELIERQLVELEQEPERVGVSRRSRARERAGTASFFGGSGGGFGGFGGDGGGCGGDGGGGGGGC
jgi:hypothetical protein